MHRSGKQRIDRTAVVMQSMVRGAVQATRPIRLGHPMLFGVDVVRDIPYAHQSKSQTLDIIRPRGRTDTLPVIIYVHGGGFHMMSKDTHWPITTTLARAGYLVVSVDYRLAPKHPFPVPLADACAATIWVTRNIMQYGGDRERIAYAGESAGANLVTALAIASCFPRTETYARALFEAAPNPRAVIAACGILQVSDSSRFLRRRRVPTWVQNYLHVVCNSYLTWDAQSAGAHSLADPLLILEDRNTTPGCRLPPFHVFCGTRDPLLDDTRRLATALRQRGERVDAHVYPGGVHAFHVLAFQRIARQCWRRQLKFLQRHMALDYQATLSEVSNVSRTQRVASEI